MEFIPQTRKRALSVPSGAGYCLCFWQLVRRCAGFVGRVWDVIGVDYVWLAGYVDGFCCVVVFLLGRMAMTEANKLTREELLAAKLQKIDDQRKELLDKLNRERVRARSKVMGTERKRRSRALILIGASCELAMKADASNMG